MHFIEILGIEFTDEIEEMVDLDVEGNHNFIIENDILSLNSGKSFFIREIADRLKRTGRSIIHLSDVKDEFKSSRFPVQEEFRGGLLEGEEPKGMKVVALRPTFFSEYYKKLPKYNYWYSPNIRNMTKGDFLTLFNVKKMTQNQRIAMEQLFPQLSTYLKENPDEKFSLSLIERFLDDIEELSESQKRLLLWKMKPIETSNYYVGKFERSLMTLLQKRFAITINMQNFDSYGTESSLRFPEVTMTIALREIISARREKKITPVWVFVDEASRFISNDKDNSLKRLILESIDLDSKENVNYAFATQFVEDMPLKLITQSKYVLIPSTADTNTMKYLLLNTGIARNQQYALNQSIYLKKEMRKTKHSWVIINRINANMEIIVPLPPLSWHTQTSE